MKIINTAQGHERVHTSRGSWTPANVREKYKAGKIKKSTAIRKLADTFDWTLKKAKQYLDS